MNLLFEADLTVLAMQSGQKGCAQRVVLQPSCALFRTISPATPSLALHDRVGTDAAQIAVVTISHCFASRNCSVDTQLCAPQAERFVSLLKNARLRFRVRRGIKPWSPK